VQSERSDQCIMVTNHWKGDKGKESSKFDRCRDFLRSVSCGTYACPFPHPHERVRALIVLFCVGLTPYNAALLTPSDMKPVQPPPPVPMPAIHGDSTRRPSFARAPTAGVRSLSIGRPIEPLDEKLHSNIVITSRYNVITFLPLNLFEQVLLQHVICV
jgi:hypothetical protein